MAKYRKKAVVVDAVKWNGKKISETPDWISEALDFDKIFRIGDKILIQTEEGEMTALPGDFIIRGIKGELYPCKPDIFQATYEEVSDSQSADNTKELLQDIISWEKDLSELLSLETILKERYIIIKR